MLRNAVPHVRGLACAAHLFYRGLYACQKVEEWVFGIAASHKPVILYIYK